MSIDFSSKTYEVIEKKPSTARYSKGVEIGDTVTFYIKCLGSVNHRGGRYSTDIHMYVNGEVHTTIAQGELNKVLNVLILEEVAEQE